MSDHEIQVGIGAVTVLAVIAGPILALYIQDKLNVRREQRGRKLWVFKTLMATRNTRVAPDHVTAVNMIDIEFYGDKGVTRAWNVYRDHLNNGPQDPKDPKIEEISKEWNKEGDRLFNIMLDKIAKAVGYDFEELLLVKGGYYPQAHSDLETDQMLLRKGLIGLLRGELNLKMDLMSMPGPGPDTEDIAAQKKLRDLSIEYFEGKHPLPVRIVETPSEQQKPPG
jgi:hypothetical protein